MCRVRLDDYFMCTDNVDAEPLSTRSPLAPSLPSTGPNPNAAVLNMIRFRSPANTHGQSVSLRVVTLPFACPSPSPPATSAWLSIILVLLRTRSRPFTAGRLPRRAITLADRAAAVTARPATSHTSAARLPPSERESGMLIAERSSNHNIP
jgi:hypothetical protein